MAGLADVRDDWTEEEYGLHREATAAILERNPLDPMALDPADYPLDACRRLMRDVKGRLDDGPGIVIVSGLPVDRISTLAAKRLYWLLSCLIERPVAQSFDGRMLYDVRDTGQRIDTRVRGETAPWPDGRRTVAHGPACPARSGPTNGLLFSVPRTQ